MLTRWPYEARGGTLARNSMTAQQGRQVTHARRAFRMVAGMGTRARDGGRGSSGWRILYMAGGYGGTKGLLVA